MDLVSRNWSPRAVLSILIALLIPVATMLVGCGGPTIVPEGTKGLAAELDYTGVEPATEISFWTSHPGGSIDVERALIAEFEKQSGIKVTLVTAGANYEEVSQKFQTAQTSRSVGDVVLLSDATWFPAYLNGSIIPLEPAVAARHLDMSGYQPALYGDYLYDGGHYAVPYARSTPIFYYNKDHYRRAGLPDRAPRTWDEAREFGQTLRRAGIDAVPFGYPPAEQYNAWTMANLAWGYGGGWSDKWDLAPVVGPKTQDALAFAQSSIKDGWATVTSGDPTTPFAAGAISQVIFTTGSLADVVSTAGFEVGVGPLPLGPVDTDKVVPTGGSGLAIAAKASPERQLAAAMFITFMTNAANTATFSAATGYLPVQVGANMDATYVKMPAFRTAVEQLSRARSQDYSRVFLPGGDRAISLALQTILTTNVAPEPALATLRDQLQRLYDRDVEPRLQER